MCPVSACFSKVPKLVGRISGDLILFVSLKRKRLGARNFAVMLIFIPASQNKRVGVSRMSFRDFRETAPRIASTYMRAILNKRHEVSPGTFAQLQNRL